jgi:predicted permease
VAAVRALVAIVPAGLPRVEAIRVDGAVLAFSLAVTTIVGLAFGLLPALEAAGTDPHRDLQEASRRTAGGHRGTRRALVVVEVALAFVLLIGAGLLLRSVRGLLAVPVGFETADLLTLQVQLVGHRFDPPGEGTRFFLRALEAVRRVPGVTAAGATGQLPLSGDRDEYGALFPDEVGLPANNFAIFRYTVTPQYVEAAGIPLVRGRTIDERDRRGAPLAAVISTSLAAARFGSADPIGHQFRVGPAGPFTIVGVVGDVRQLSLASSDAQAVYINADQSWFADRAMSFVVRTGANPAEVARAVQQAVWSVDKDQPVVRIATMASLVEASAAERRFALVIFEGFAVVSLVLAAIGIYGILAGGVAERAREIGLRAALGATRGQIVGMVVRQGLLLTAAGGMIGLAGSALASRALLTLLFGVSRLDPLTYGTVVALLASVALAACTIPALRAVRVDPSTALRAE